MNPHHVETADLDGPDDPAATEGAAAVARIAAEPTARRPRRPRRRVRSVHVEAPRELEAGGPELATGSLHGELSAISAAPVVLGWRAAALVGGTITVLTLLIVGAVFALAAVLEIPAATIATQAWPLLAIVCLAVSTTSAQLALGLARTRAYPAVA